MCFALDMFLTELDMSLRDALDEKLCFSHEQTPHPSAKLPPSPPGEGLDYCEFVVNCVLNDTCLLGVLRGGLSP